MDKNKAKQATMIVNRINKCKSILVSLKGRSYNDEFTIHYRGVETCELEEDMLQMIVEHYENELKKLNAALENL